MDTPKEDDAPNEAFKRKNVVYQLTVEGLLGMLENPYRGKLLDVGCGYGYITKLLAEKTDFEITAMDNDAFVLEGAKEVLRGCGNVKVEKQDVFNLPYKDGEFDVAISTGYVCVASVLGVIDEIRRVVKDGGVIILDYKRDYHLYRLLNGRIFRDLRDYLTAKKYYFGQVGLRKYFSKHGLRVEEIESFHTYPPFLGDRDKMLFEKTVGRVFKPLLAKILLVKIKNENA